MKLTLEYDSEKLSLATDLTGVKSESELVAHIMVARRIAGLLHPSVEDLELWLPARSPADPAAE